MCFAFEPRRIHPEVIDQTVGVVGALLISMLDPSLPVPLLRYRTGDVARLVTRDQCHQAARQVGCLLPDDLPATMVLVRGRARDVLPDGSDVAFYKDLVYAEAGVADRLTGAVRVEVDGAATTVHVQCRPEEIDDTGHEEITTRLQALLHGAGAAPVVRPWSYRTFPFGMTLDYERKFVGYVPTPIEARTGICR